jgi:DNA-binding NarL/FixJ family response regulator
MVKELKQVIHVVLVDDHTMVREGLRSILEGYDNVTVVGEASNGREAVEAVEMLQPTIVVMDINMPIMNGIEATTFIKARHPHVTVIGLSVNAQKENKVRMTAAGAAALISKEDAFEELHAAIEQAIQRRTS